MVPANFYNEYNRNAISTSSQGKLILMMYDGAIKFVNLALKSLEDKNVSDRSTYIRKTHDIINELSCSLNIEKGGEVAEQLEKLYQFMLRQLTLANIKGDQKALESVLQVLRTLHEGWDQIINEKKAEEVPSMAPVVPGRSIASKC